MFKLIALDLDGTLNNSDKQITPRTKAALIAAQQQRAIVVLASARPEPGLAREAAELDLAKYHGLLLSYNGGRVKDSTSGEVLYEHSMRNADAKRLLRHLEQYPALPIVDDGEYIYTDRPDGFQMRYESEGNNLPIRQVENVCDAVDFNPYKILIACPEETFAPIIAEIQRPFEDCLSFVMSTPFYLEITPKGISKAVTLRSICDRLGIEREQVIAFGDGQNDISMIEFAGVGVAMGNACDELKAAADQVTLSNDEDGIAHILGKYYAV